MTTIWRLSVTDFPKAPADLPVLIGTAGVSILTTLSTHYERAQAAEDKGFMANDLRVESQGQAAVATIRAITADLFTGGDEALAVALLDLVDAEA